MASSLIPDESLTPEEVLRLNYEDCMKLKHKNKQNECKKFMPKSNKPKVGTSRSETSRPIKVNGGKSKRRSTTRRKSFRKL